MSIVAPLSMAMVACGGGGDEGYNEVVIDEKPIPIDKNDPTLRDTKGKTEQIFLFSDNKIDSTKAYVDEISRIAIKNTTPNGDTNNKLDVSNINLYRIPADGNKPESGSTTTTDNVVGAVIVDSPDLKYSAAGTVLFDSENAESVVTATQLNSRANAFLSSLSARLGADHVINVVGSKNGMNSDGGTVTVSGTIQRKDQTVGIDKYPVIQHKRMRDEMLSVLFNTPVWTKPSLGSDYGKISSESKSLNFTVTTWAYKGAIYIWVSTNDGEQQDAIDLKFGRYNSGTSLSSAASYLIDADSDPTTQPNPDDKFNPAVKDTLSKTEKVYYLPKNGKGETSGLNDNVAMVALLNLQPRGLTQSAVNAENISLYRSPLSGTGFESDQSINSSNASGAILLDDPAIKYSGAGVSAGNSIGGGQASSNELNAKANDYVGALKAKLGKEVNITVTNVSRTDNNDGPVVNLTGSIKRSAAKNPSDPYPLLQHKRIRDEMLSVQLNKPVWTKPTLSSDFAKGSSESSEIIFNVTTWSYKGITYLWVSSHDKAQTDKVSVKYGRYDSGMQVSAVARNIIKDEVSDKGDPSVLDQLSRTEQVYYFLNNASGNPSDFIDNVSQVALIEVEPANQPSKKISPSNVSLLRLPRGMTMLPVGVPTTLDNSIGSILLDDPELLYSGSGSIIAQKEVDASDPNASNPSVTELSDNANNFFNLLRYRLGSDYQVKVNDVVRGVNGDGATVTLKGTIKRTDGTLSGSMFPVMQHKRMRDEMLSVQYNRPVWSKPTLESNWGSANSESKELTFSVTTWAYKGATYLWSSSYDSTKAAQVAVKYGRFDNGSSLSSSIKALENSN